MDSCGEDVALLMIFLAPLAALLVQMAISPVIGLCDIGAFIFGELLTSFFGDVHS